MVSSLMRGLIVVRLSATLRCRRVIRLHSAGGAQDVGPGQFTITLGGAALDTSEIAVFLGQAIGKSDQHRHEPTAAGKAIYDKSQ